MALTTAQLQAIKAYIDATPELAAQPLTADGAFAIAEALNVTAAPDYWVWRSAMPLSDVYGLTSPAPVNRVWDWTFYSGMNAGEQGAWMEMAGPDRALQMSLPNIRAGIGVIFTGPQGGANARDHILALGRRLATVVEKILASGAGTTASPSIMGFEGGLTYADVLAARDS